MLSLIHNVWSWIVEIFSVKLPHISHSALVDYLIPNLASLHVVQFELDCILVELALSCLILIFDWSFFYLLMQRRRAGPFFAFAFWFTRCEVRINVTNIFEYVFIIWESFPNIFLIFYLILFIFIIDHYLLWQRLIKTFLSFGEWINSKIVVWSDTRIVLMRSIWLGYWYS